jgi:hypothetical protein
LDHLLASRLLVLLERGRPRADPAANVPPPTAVDRC